VLNLGPLGSTPATLGNDYPGISVPLPFKTAKEQLLSSFERAYVEALLARWGGNITQAAQAAGLSRQHLYLLIHRSTGTSPDEIDPNS
jgi:DNA-binding NtrC family response regulator